MEQKMKD